MDGCCTMVHPWARTLLGWVDVATRPNSLIWRPAGGPRHVPGLLLLLRVGPWQGKGQRPDLSGQGFGQRLCLGAHSVGVVPPLWVPWGLLSWMSRVGV